MKVLCPAHKDSTPSLHLYQTRAWCFVCNYTCPIEEVTDAETRKQIKKEPEDIEAMVSYIVSLPLRPCRGLTLHTESEGYYVLWPTHDYYKLRCAAGKTRYIGPRGRRPPLFNILRDRGNTLVVVEGELNALSLAEVFPEAKFNITSPGAASEFQRYVEDFSRYSSVVLVLDRDAAGIANGVVVKELLTRRGVRCNLVLVERDFNDLLQQSPETLRDFFRKETRLG